MHPGKSILGEYSEASAILPRSTKLCQNDGIFSRVNREIKVGWLGRTVMLILVRKSLVEKGSVSSALSWCNRQFICRPSSGRSLCTSSRSHRKTSQYYDELMASPARKDYFLTILFMSDFKLLRRYHEESHFLGCGTCGYCKNRCFGGTNRLHHQSEKNPRLGC
jgi:hypothetical protein